MGMDNFWSEDRIALDEFVDCLETSRLKDWWHFPVIYFSRGWTISFLGTLSQLFMLDRPSRMERIHKSSIYCQALHEAAP